MKSYCFFLSVMILQQTLHLQFQYLHLMDYYNLFFSFLFLFFKKWITDNLLVSHNDPSRCARHGGSGKSKYWKTISKSIFFVTDKYDNHPNISQLPLIFAIVLFRDIFWSKTKNLYFFDWLFKSRWSNWVYSLINASLPFLSPSFINSRYFSPFLWSVLPVLVLKNVFILYHQ